MGISVSSEDVKINGDSCAYVGSDYLKRKKVKASSEEESFCSTATKQKVSSLYCSSGRGLSVKHLAALLS